MKRICLTGLLCLLALPAFADDWVYTLRPGDDLWSIAEKFCGSGNHAQELAAHNNLTSPNNIRAGQRINIPTQLLIFQPSSATIEDISGEVALQRDPSNAAQLVPARKGDIVEMGASLVTKEGAVLVRFADGSSLSIQPRSKVLFNKLTSFGPAGMVDTHLRFSYGRGNAKIKPQNTGARFRIQTPEGIAAVRGTEFRVGHQIANNSSISNTETLSGQVSFIRSGQSTNLPAGFGVVASPAGVIKEALLPAPSWAGKWAGNYASVVMQQSISWLSVVDANHYVVSWANSTAPDIVFAQSSTQNTHTLVEQVPGNYLLSVRAVSNNSIEGLDALVQLDVKAVAPELTSVTNLTAGATTFNWHYPQATREFELTVDAEHWQHSKSILVTAQSHALPLTAGVYSWQVAAAESAVSTRSTFTLLPNVPTGLTVDRQAMALAISWVGVDQAESYRLSISNSNTPEKAPITIETDATDATVMLTDYGKYTVQLASMQNSLHSGNTQTNISVARTPWWLLLFAIPLLVL
ncbi:MAG: LysM peptidoglycan-binding domain-containing protein [Gammaproteobacteria bacterium]|nr:LysM peptidoglycan-binding domain-containing protein [Gammaproteobacteria bacterium]